MECSQLLNTFKYYSVSINRKLDTAEELKQSFPNLSSVYISLVLLSLIHSCLSYSCSSFWQQFKQLCLFSSLRSSIFHFDTTELPGHILISWSFQKNATCPKLSWCACSQSRKHVINSPWSLDCHSGSGTSLVPALCSREATC